MCLHVGKSAFSIAFSDRARRGNAFAYRERGGRVIYEHGVEGTSLDEVMAASGVSKSQLYHYFADKDALRVTGENQVEPIWDRFRKSPGSTVQQYDYL